MAKNNIAVTVDSVVICKVDGILKVLLVQRKNDPFKDHWALPGGFVDEGEDLETAARRELQEETGITVDSMEQVKAFGEPGRDPRGHMISIAFVSVLSSEKSPYAADDAKDAKWFELAKVNSLPLAFDHQKIIKEAQQFL